MLQSRQPRILVVGVLPSGPQGLSNELRRRIAAADLLIGGLRLLDYFPESQAERLPIGADIVPVVEQLQRARAADRQVVVLASGDPLCYGIGASLRRFLPAEALEIVPAPSSFQLAFAALAEPWHDAVLLSAHGRPLDEVIGRVLAAPKAALLTDRHNTPAAIARALLSAGAHAQSSCAVCENLGTSEQRIVRTSLCEVADEGYAALNVFVVWRQHGAERLTRTSPGLSDEAFSTSAGQITKREVRLLCLAELALGPNEVLWDIGAGSGSVGIEAARAQPSAIVYAVERRADMCEHARENLRRFPAPSLHLLEGNAPEACIDWPAPHAVFIGGSGGRLESIVELARSRLRAGGRLVINLATLEHLQLVRQLLPDANVAQVQISRAVPIQMLTRFEALNPVFVVTWRAPGATL